MQWVLLAFLWARYSGSAYTKLQRGDVTLDEQDPMEYLVGNIL